MMVPLDKRWGWARVTGGNHVSLDLQVDIWVYLLRSPEVCPSWNLFIPMVCPYRKSFNRYPGAN